MPRVKFTRRFTKAYLRLSSQIRTKTKKALALLEKDPRHPSLQTKPIQGHDGFYEARVDIHYRMTYIRLSGDIIVMSNVDMHNDALRNP